MMRYFVELRDAGVRRRPDFGGVGRAAQPLRSHRGDVPRPHHGHCRHGISTDIEEIGTADGRPADNESSRSSQRRIELGRPSPIFSLAAAGRRLAGARRLQSCWRWSARGWCSQSSAPTRSQLASQGHPVDLRLQLRVAGCRPAGHAADPDRAWRLPSHSRSAHGISAPKASSMPAPLPRPASGCSFPAPQSSSCR